MTDMSRRGKGLDAEFFLRQRHTLDHVLELGVGDVPGAGPEAAIRSDVNPFGAAEHADGVQDPVADQLRRFDEVGVDVEDSEPERRLVGEIAELLDDLIAGSSFLRRSELAAVLIRDADAERPSSCILLDVR